MYLSNEQKESLVYLLPFLYYLSNFKHSKVLWGTGAQPQVHAQGNVFVVFYLEGYESSCGCTSKSKHVIYIYITLVIGGGELY